MTGSACEPCVVRKQAVDNVADEAYHFPVGPFVATPDVISLPDASSFDHGHQGVAMIGNVQPVPDIGAIPVDRQ